MPDREGTPRDRVRWLMFGRESGVPAPVPPSAAVFYPFLADDEECCEECGAIKPRAELCYLGSTEDGEALYACAEHGIADA